MRFGWNIDPILQQRDLSLKLSAFIHEGKLKWIKLFFKERLKSLLTSKIPCIDLLVT